MVLAALSSCGPQGTQVGGIWNAGPELLCNNIFGMCAKYRLTFMSDLVRRGGGFLHRHCFILLFQRSCRKCHDLSRASVSRACGREIALAHSVSALNFAKVEWLKPQIQSSSGPAEPDKVCKKNSPCSIERHFPPRELTISSNNSREGKCARVTHICIRSIPAKCSFDLVPELPKHIAKAYWSLKSGTRTSTAERQSVHKEENAMVSRNYSAQQCQLSNLNQ